MGAAMVCVARCGRCAVGAAMGQLADDREGARENPDELRGPVVRRRDLAGLG